EALYEAPYQAHAAMEPLNCTVWLQPDRLDVWISTQSAPAVLAGAAAAAAIAKAVGRPVKLVWTREQDIQHDRYRPQAATKWKARIDENGKIDALDVKVA